MFWFYLPLLQVFPQKCQTLTVNYNVTNVFRNSGDVNLVFLEDCIDAAHADLRATRINSAIWTVDRLNVLQAVAPLSLGLEIYDVCDTSQYFNTIYQLFQKRKTNVTFGIVTVQSLPGQIRGFCDVLNIDTKVIQRNYKHIIWATIELLTALNWKSNVTVVLQHQNLIDDVLRLTRKAWICVGNIMNLEKLKETKIQPNVTYIIMADGYMLNNTINNSSVLIHARKVILVSVDGSKLKNVPTGYYFIEGYNENIIPDFTKTAKIVPTPILFDIIHPFVSFAKSLKLFLGEHCNNTVDLTRCIRDNYYKKSEYLNLGDFDILNFLQIEPLQSKFNFEVYVSDNSSSNTSFTKLASYNIFQEIFLEYDDNDYFDKYSNHSNDKDCAKQRVECVVNCMNFWTKTTHSADIRLRPEAWVFAFLAISTLGVVFCVAILVFIFNRVNKRQILEGNPILSILLLITVLFMFFSIVAFTLDGDEETKGRIVLIRSFCITLPYAAAFSLILGRVILLATISRDLGFMTHISGAVQCFLTLFIFGVQCALSLQITMRCDDILQTTFLLYLLSYNIILLVLLLCLSPLITKSQRNYREGRYFVISTVLIAFTWCCWIPGYLLLNEDWKDPMLCGGLVMTASIILGAIFIPRTYLITVSATRDKFSNALPSLAAVTNTLDIYTASAQIRKVVKNPRYSSPSPKKICEGDL